MRPTLQTVPENCTATANQTSAGAAVVPTTPNGNREPATAAVEKTTPATNHATPVTVQEKTPSVVHPPQSQQLQAVKPRNSSRVSPKKFSQSYLCCWFCDFVQCHCVVFCY